MATKQEGYGNMKKEIAKEKKHKFLYQTFDESSEDEDKIDTKALMEENPIQGLRWLKGELKAAMENHSKIQIRGESKHHTMKEPSEEVKELTKKPKFKSFLKHLNVRSPTVIQTSGKWVLADVQEYLLIKERLDIVQACIRSTVSLNDCKNCQRSYNSVRQHLRGKDCRKAYTEEDLADLKEAADWHRKQELSERYKQYKDEIAEEYQRKKYIIANKRDKMRKEISKKNSDYYQRNGPKIRQKARKYYAKNREEILKRKAEDRELDREEKTKEKMPLADVVFKTVK